MSESVVRRGTSSGDSAAWPTVRLGSVASFINGDRGKNYPSGDAFVEDGVPFINAGHIRDGGVEYHSMNYIDESRYDLLRSGKVRERDILYCLRGSLGKTAVIKSPRKAAIASSLVIIRPSPACHVEYLYRFLTSPLADRLVHRFDSGSAQPNLSVKRVKDYTLPLPPLGEQRRIADILDRADAIRRKRRAAIALTEELLQSAFVAGVGSGHPDYGTWPLTPISRLAVQKKSAIRSGPFGSALKHSEFVEQGIAVLGIDNAVQNRFAWGERRYITAAKYEALKRYRVYPGDVIITIMGTTGRSAVVPDDIPEAITTKHLATITLDRSKALPEYIAHAIHRDDYLLHQIRSRNRGAIMAGLNLGIIRELRVHLPPLPIQRAFVERLAAIEALRDRLTAAADEADTLFHALTQRAFRGDL